MHTPATKPHRLARPQSHWRIAVCLLAVSLSILGPVRAGISEPDATVYGTIAINGQPVTAADTHLVVEARRFIASAPIASYRIGSDPAAGDFYVLRLKVESGLPLDDPNASLIGDSLFIVVADAGAIRAQATVTISARADVQRVDLGAAADDSDGDTLPDAWETAQFSNLTYGPNTLALNGQTALQNFIAGTNPNDTNSLFAVQITSVNEQVAVSFPSLRAEGAGYGGRTRLYTLQSCLELETNWQDVAGYTRLTGNNQLISYQPSPTNAPAFYRARVWLE